LRADLLPVNLSSLPMAQTFSSMKTETIMIRMLLLLQPELQTLSAQLVQLPRELLVHRSPQHLENILMKTSGISTK